MAVLVQCCAAIALLFLVHLTWCHSVYAQDEGFGRCPHCDSGYVWRHIPSGGGVEKTCQCQDPCEHYDCGPDMECVSKEFCMWGTQRCLQYRTCQRMCKHGTPEPTTPSPRLPMCEQPSVTGPCFGAIPRYFFNKAAGKCQTFLYGGCDGNDNNFRSEFDCINACVGPDNTYCSLPSKTGVCQMYIPSFYYNSNTGNCERFVYGGCSGNGNRFETLAECEKYCPQSTTPGPTVSIPCFYNGKQYAPGDSFPSSDGCNNCFCIGNGGVGCTKMACAKTV